MEDASSGLRLWQAALKTPLLLVVGLLLLGWLFNTPAGLLGKADAIAYAVCHRIDLRSFYLGERQLPLCARCTGMYLGAMLGLVYQNDRVRRHSGAPPRRVLAVLGLLGVGFVMDGLNSFASVFPGAPSLYPPQNWLRLLTGTGMGLVISAALYPAFNQTIWKDWLPQPALGSLRSVGILVVLAVAVDLMVLTGNTLLLYPLALISAAGVFVLLTLVYAMVWVMFWRADNAYLRLQELVVPLTAGFGLALVQIILLDVGRYLLTGTWDGFHIG